MISKLAKSILNDLVEAMLSELEIYTKEELTETLKCMPDQYIRELYEEYIIKPLIDDKQTIAALEYKIKTVEYEIFLIESAMYEIKSYNPYYPTLVKRKEKCEEELNKLNEELNRIKPEEIEEPVEVIDEPVDVNLEEVRRRYEYDNLGYRNMIGSIGGSIFRDPYAVYYGNIRY
jgi:hypothetical protein